MNFFERMFSGKLGVIQHAPSQETGASPMETPAQNETDKTPEKIEYTEENLKESIGYFIQHWEVYFNLHLADMEIDIDSLSDFLEDARVKEGVEEITLKQFGDYMKIYYTNQEESFKKKHALSDVEDSIKEFKDYIIKFRNETPKKALED